MAAEMAVVMAAAAAVGARERPSVLILIVPEEAVGVGVMGADECADRVATTRSVRVIRFARVVATIRTVLAIRSAVSGIRPIGAVGVSQRVRLSEETPRAQLIGEGTQLGTPETAVCIGIVLVEERPPRSVKHLARDGRAKPAPTNPDEGAARSRPALREERPHAALAVGEQPPRRLVLVREMARGPLLVVEAQLDAPHARVGSR